MTKPTVTLLADYPNWAFDYVARSIAARLSHRFKFRIEYAARHPWLTGKDTDLLYVFFWGYKVPKEAGFAMNQVIKEVASWGWCHGHSSYPACSEKDFVDKYLDDCGVVTTPCAGIYQALQALCPRAVHCPNGVEYEYFAAGSTRGTPRGPLKIGWVGNAEDEHKVKGLQDVLLPGASGYDLKVSGGKMTRRDLRNFYGAIDVLAVASSYESQPLPLLESMSAGCFPVCTDVGIVPELISSGSNGLVVSRSPEAFAEAFKWCADNVETLRARRPAQRQFAATQSWDVWASRFGDLFDFALASRGDDDSGLPPELARLAERTTGFQVGRRFDSRSRGPGRRLSGKMQIDCGDCIRHFFLGSRFERGRGEAVFRWYERSSKYVVAVCRRFKELALKQGLANAFALAMQSGLRQFFRCGK